MAQFIRELRAQARLNHYKENLWADIYVEEYKTTWRVSAKFVGFAMCSAENWKYTKREYKNLNTVVNQFIQEYNERNNGLRK